MENNINNYGQQPNEQVIAPGYQQNYAGAAQNNVNVGAAQNSAGAVQNNIYSGARQMNQNAGNMYGYPQQVNPNVNAQAVNGYVNPGINPGVNPGMNNMQGQNPARGTRISGYVHRKMEGMTGYIIISAVIAAIIGGLIGYAIVKAFPDLIYESKQHGRMVVREKTISGSFMMGAIEGAFIGFFYVLIFSIFITHTKKEINGGSFNLDELHLDYSVRSFGFNKIRPSLTINGVNATIANAEESDRAVFLPMLKNYDKTVYRKYRVRYYITRIRGRVIRISADGSIIYIDGTKVVDNRQQIVSFLPPLQGRQF
ncbi:MAG: hypothetical protein IJJ74_11925 [Eubacterium sp.]|nr:hypothetical protein [Eubacterium sp.]